MFIKSFHKTILPKDSNRFDSPLCSLKQKNSKRNNNLVTQ